MWIEPDWALPPGVRAAMTTRQGGCSIAPYDALNLGTHVGDRPEAVAANRLALLRSLGVGVIAWLEQVHGNDVADIDLAGWDSVHRADAAIASRPGIAVAIMVADCLPVLMALQDGRRVAGVHAGWRGLANGVIGRTLAAMEAPGAEVECWLGPSISAARYEVDATVRSAFGTEVSHCFSATTPGHYLMDLAAIAEVQLRDAGVLHVRHAGRCVFDSPEQWFSHRRDGITGRCAALIWREG